MNRKAYAEEPLYEVALVQSPSFPQVAPMAITHLPSKNYMAGRTFDTFRVGTFLSFQQGLILFIVLSLSYLFLL